MNKTLPQIFLIHSIGMPHIKSISLQHILNTLRGNFSPSFLDSNRIAPLFQSLKHYLLSDIRVHSFSLPYQLLVSVGPGTEGMSEIMQIKEICHQCQTM